MAADWSSPNMVADSSLTPDAQERLREVGVRLDFESNQQIHREGERHAYLYLAQRIKFHTIALHEERMLPLSVRLGRRLIQVCDHHNQVHLNHTDIADLVGASRYAVGRVLRSFQDQGYVNMRYGCIEIANHQGIANYLSTQSDLG